MATTPQNGEAGFENDVNELPEDQDNNSAETLEEELPDEDGDIEEAQEDAAEVRKEGGYQ